MSGVVLRSLQHEGQTAQPGVAEDPENGLRADGPLADLGVAVLPGSQGVNPDIDVDRQQAVPADDPVELPRTPSGSPAIS